MTDATPPIPGPNDPGPGVPAAKKPEPAATKPTPPAGGETTKPPRATEAKDPLRGSRASGIWAGVVVLGLVLVLLIIFISQNTQEVSVAFLSWEGTAPLSVVLLAAAAGGLFLTVAAGTVRILQLRHRVRQDKKRAKKR